MMLLIKLEGDYLKSLRVENIVNEFGGEVHKCATKISPNFFTY